MLFGIRREPEVESGWLTVEQIRNGWPTTFGAASGVVASAVAITPPPPAAP
ncbi:hypothetical protein [Mycobacterium sp. AZCC_0083]|uniref:hypothetical protein n=1 Tax=Mycobacterium sp. AZCC_0083 TaxID=2735882 RepID=UPI0018061565|nr:hypothetical protein [Mycobacterium sp. AZCC_0083]MBB5162052.1 ammonia channel protein AmtB [Mycobacterium sp. AZCC_0083]